MKSGIWTCLMLATLLGSCGDGRTPLVLYSPHGRDLLVLLEQTYEENHPGVDVRWLDMGSQEVYDRIRSEAANPQADVWFGGPDTIFASNTSGFSITDLSEAVSRKDKFAGMHWFSPAFVMKLIEIIHGPDTSEETIQLLEQVGAALPKETIRVKDTKSAYGFVANRIYFAAVAEARKVMEEEIATVDDINKAMRFGFNWPAGPLEMIAGARKGWQ